MRPTRIQPPAVPGPQPSGLTPDGAPVYRFGGLEFVRVPAGPFWMGAADSDPDAFPDEKPRHQVNLPYDYFIGRYAVTYGQFRLSPAGRGWRTPPGKKDHPIVDVQWEDVRAYLDWLNRTFRADLPPGLVFRLPSEAEWEKAARGTDGRLYPWGDAFEPARCNSAESTRRGTLPVGSLSPQGDSPWGAAEMAGNVREWTGTLYRPYPYDPFDGREDPDAPGPRVSRGGSFFDYYKSVRVTFRSANSFTLFRGFRIAVGPQLS